METKNAVITGATKGIGRATALIFARNGYNLCICSRHDADLMKFEEELQQINPSIKIHWLATDLSSKNGVVAFAEFVHSKFSKVDMLLNNAGIFIGGQLHDEPEGVMEETLYLNYLCAYRLTRHVLKLMLPYHSGHIFNLCSIASFTAYPGGGSYAVSKFALLGFSKSLREEMKPHNIKVTALMPGATYTSSWESAGLPEDRFMPAEDVANIIFAMFSLSSRTCVEEIIMRPQLGDI